MISIKDYANETGVSYEAVRQRIKRYEEDLTGHIHRQGRTQYLDDVAVAFLNDHRLQNPVVVYDKGAGEDFRELQDELQETKALAKEYWDQLKAKEGTMRLLIEENKELRLQASSVALLEANNEAARVKTAQAEKEAQEARQELVKAHTAFEEDLTKKNERILALEKYAADVAAYNALPGWRRLFTKAPELQED